MTSSLFRVLSPGGAFQAFVSLILCEVKGCQNAFTDVFRFPRGFFSARFCCLKVESAYSYSTFIFMNPRVAESMGLFNRTRVQSTELASVVWAVEVGPWVSE